jgi:hypothetical protein
MGNRAVIATEAKDIGVYVHWNGGRDSIEAFLKYAELRGFRPPEKDSYGWARLTQVIANFFGGDLSIGVGKYDTLDTNNYDNGVYLIKDWHIVGRENLVGDEQDEHDLLDMLLSIDKAQPKRDRLGEKLIKEKLSS